MNFSLMSVTMQQITVFLSVAEYGGFAKASGHLHMTQSAISKSIAKLEKDLEIILFERTTRGICLTEPGKSLYNDWTEQIKQMHNSYVKAYSLQKKEHSTLRIGLMNTVKPSRYFDDIKKRFQERHPEIALDLMSEYITDLEDNLCKGEYDIIMIPDFERFALEQWGIAWKWVACSNAYVLMSKSNPLAEKISLQTTDILNEDFMTLEHGKGKFYQQDLEERLAPYNVKPHVVSHYKNAYEIQYLFRTENSTILLIDDYFDYPDMSDVIRLPIADQKNGIICAWNPNNKKEALQKFLTLLTPAE